jgi:hypothetical protein
LFGQALFRRSTSYIVKHEVNPLIWTAQYLEQFGSFAAHEIKSKVTGAVVDVEVGEAEWNLDVLESLFRRTRQSSQAQS